MKSTIELFMSEYFLIKAILGRYLEDSVKLFIALGKIFLIPEEETGRLHRLAENPVARGITTEKEFMQHQRMRKYSKMTGGETSVNAEWDEVVAIKGNAILAAQNAELLHDAEVSGNVVYTSLSSAATSGMVCALRIMGILQCEGIYLAKNEKAGVRNLSKAAEWNDSISTLALLRYRPAKRERNMARLRQELVDTPFAALYNAAAQKYGFDDAPDIGEIRLLEKAFSSGVLKREVYEPKYARILGSRALGIKDKEKAVFSLNKEILSVIADLPLKLSRDKITAVDVGGVESVPVKRKSEIEAIVRALKNGDLRGLPSYRPVCLCCESGYVLEMYAKAIAAKNAGAHVEVIDVAELIEYDFEPTPNNIFVRSIDEDRDNRFLLFFRGEITERKIDAVRSVLQSARRAKFYLNTPSVTLDLSALLTVCFCDGQNARLLKPYCDVIQLAEISAEELPAAVEDILAEKQKAYGVGGINLSGDAREVFRGYDIDTAEKLIDSAVRARREKGAVINLSRAVLQEYAPEHDTPKIGFGGNVNDRHK